jgi:hypothetical protein
MVRRRKRKRTRMTGTRTKGEGGTRVPLAGCHAEGGAGRNDSVVPLRMIGTGKRKSKRKNLEKEFGGGGGDEDCVAALAA